MTSVASHIPVLETKRLTLRAPTRADWPTYAGVLMSDRARYMSGASSEKEAWAFFLADLGSWALDGFGYWAATSKESDDPLVFLGIAAPPSFPETELGWFATAEAEGCGFACEAAGAALEWAFVTRKLTTLVSYIDRDNARSIALAERLGATLDDGAARPDPEDVVYRHSRRAA